MEKILFKEIRKITNVGASLGISLPAYLLEKCNMPKGKLVAIYQVGEDVLISTKFNKSEVKINHLEKEKGKK